MPFSLTLTGSVGSWADAIEPATNSKSSNAILFAVSFMVVVLVALREGDRSMFSADGSSTKNAFSPKNGPVPKTNVAQFGNS